MFRFGVFIFILSSGLLLSSCASSQLPVNQQSSWQSMVATSAVFKQNHTGFALYDIEKKSTVADYQSDKYFTTASNVKLYSFYAGLCMLGDSVPALKYTSRNDSLFFCGTGDPTLLHPDMPASKVLSFLKNWNGKLFWYEPVYQGKRFGSGWSWADYADYYQVELTGLPIYGNLVRFTNKKISPRMFKDSLRTATWSTDFEISREEHSNQFFSKGWPNRPFETDVPFKTSTALTAQLLQDTLQKPVRVLTKMPFTTTPKTLYSLPVDTVYRRMLQLSDNMLAEQLLLMCASKADSTNIGFDSEKGIDYIKKKYMNDLPDEPIWVDGSGLSRYNLVTPRTTVKLLQKIYEKIPQQRLFSLMAIGGRAGTIRSQYKAVQPYVFAKSGTLANNYNLSGYLKTKSGKVLIFSVMNGMYARSSGEIRREVERILTEIHEKY